MGSGLKDIVIGAVLITASFFIPGAAFIGATLFSIGSSFAIRGLTRSFLSQKQEGVQANILSTQANLPVVYGQTRLGMKIVDARIAADGAAIFEDADNDDVLVLVGAFCLGSEDGSGIEEVRSMYFYDSVQASTSLSALTPNTDLDLTGILEPFQDGDRFGPDGRLGYSLRLGTDVQTVSADLIAQLAWEATMAGKGIAYIALFMLFDQDVFRGGVPSVTAQIKGNKLYDPRTSTWAWSDNPALCILDYLTSQRYGAKRPYAARDGGTDDEINEQSFIDAANYCDELVSIPDGTGTQKRFRCNGWFDPGVDPANIIADLLSSCRGELLWEGGQYRLFIRQPTVASAFALTEDNIVGEIDWVRGGASVPNIIEATFIDELQNYTPQSVVWPVSGDLAFLTQDSDIEVKHEIDLPFTPNRYQALHTTMTMLREIRQDVVIGVTAHESALQLQVGTVVPFTHSALGFTAKEFWVVSMSIMPAGTVRLILQEYDVNAYSLDSLDANPTVPGTDLPNPFSVVPPSGLILTSDSTTALETQDDILVPQIKGVFTPSTDPFLDNYIVEYKAASSTVWESRKIDKSRVSFLLGPVTDGETYSIRLAAVNTLNAKSAWVTGSIEASTEKVLDRNIYDWDVIDNGDGTRTFKGTAGASVSQVYVFDRSFSNSTAPDNPWPIGLAGYTSVLSIPVDALDPTNLRFEYTFTNPLENAVRKIEFLPVTATLKGGRKIRLSVDPDPPAFDLDTDIPAGSIVSAKMVRSAQLYDFPDTAWSKDAWDIVSWGAATLRFSDAQEYAILADSLTMLNSEPYYIYWTSADPTSFLTTQDWGDVVGDNVVLVATARKANHSDTLAFLGTAVGVLALSDETLNPRAVTADKVRANTLTGVEIFGTSVSSIFADFGIMTGGLIQNGAGTFFIDLDATGTEPLLSHAEFELLADGTAHFRNYVLVGSDTVGLGHFTEIDGGDLTTITFEAQTIRANTGLVFFSSASPVTQRTVTGNITTGTLADLQAWAQSLMQALSTPPLGYNLVIDSTT